MKKNTIRLLAICICTVLLILSLASCSESGTTYVTTKDINFNYNNISAGISDIWVENDALYYNNYDIITRIDGKGSEDIISSPFYFSLGVQVYGEKAYILNTKEDEEGYFLMEYNAKTGKKLREWDLRSTSAYITTDYKRFLIVDGMAYIWNEDMSVGIIELDTDERELIDDRIVACGAADGKFMYLKRGHEFIKGSAAEKTISKYIYSVYCYDREANKEILLGEFSDMETFDVYHDPYISFTDRYVVFTTQPSEAEEGEATLHIYDYIDNKQTERRIYFKSDEIIAFDEYAFIVEQSTEYDEEYDELTYFEAKLHRICLETGEMEEVAEFEASFIDIFVTSDEDVYVKSSEYNGVIRFNVSTGKEHVIEYDALTGIFKDVEEI